MAVPMALRKERNRVLRDLGERKNREFRERMVGRTLSVVTLHEPGAALTGNYLKVQLASLWEANLMADLQIGGLTRDGLREAEPLV